MDSTLISELLKRTRKVPKSGKQRCFRLSLELDSKLQEITEAAESITGYNVSVAHVARMILETYHLEVLDALSGRVEEILEVAMEDPEYDKDILETEDDDLEDTEDAPEEEIDPEEEYIRSLLRGKSPITGAKWGN